MLHTAPSALSGPFVASRPGSILASPAVMVQALVDDRATPESAEGRLFSSHAYIELGGVAKQLQHRLRPAAAGNNDNALADACHGDVLSMIAVALGADLVSVAGNAANSSPLCGFERRWKFKPHDNALVVAVENDHRFIIVLKSKLDRTALKIACIPLRVLTGRWDGADSAQPRPPRGSSS